MTAEWVALKLHGVEELMKSTNFTENRGISALPGTDKDGAYELQ